MLPIKVTISFLVC